MKRIVEENPICAILRNISSDMVEDYAEAVYRGGIRMFEIAMNSEDGPGQIKRLRRRFENRPDVWIGAGTVITEERCRAAEEAGAMFFLTPSVSKNTLRYCQKRSIPLLPGVMTPTDVAICLDYGYHVMKLFPAKDLPATYIRSLKGPFDGIDYVAVGGVNADNIADFFKNGFLGVGIGSNLIPKEYIKNRRWDQAEACVRETVQKAGKERMMPI